ncbi:MAG: hypothetical protein NTY16_07655 [Deltaproteobacteria bacterium]|nr:hypothetical protein [Deltaproteobacteria bacterium]
METFTFAAVSLTIAISLLISKKKTSVHRSFAWLCAAVFLYKGAAFFDGIFQRDFLKMVETLGLLSIPPWAIAFTRMLLNEQTFLSKSYLFFVTAFSLLTAGALYAVFHLKYAFFSAGFYLIDITYAFVGSVLILCYLALFTYMKTKAIGAEKKRMLYLVIACTITIVLICVDLAQITGYGFSFHTNMVLAALIYFILMIITHPQLTELHDIMARALVIFLMTFFAAVIILIFTSLFGKNAIPFNHILVASFIIIISIEPFKQILKKILKLIYPESPDVFTSLYALDERLEREKTQLRRSKRGASKTAGCHYRRDRPSQRRRFAISQLCKTLSPAQENSVDQPGC